MVSTRIRSILTVAAITPVMFWIPSGTTSAEVSMGNPAILHLPPTGGCPVGYVCLYEHVNLGGEGYALRNGRDFNDFRGIEFNDKVSSWVNATSNRYCWYPDINFSGPARPVQPRAAENVNLYTDNDIASAIEDC